MAVKLICAVNDEMLKQHYQINKDQQVPWITKLKNGPRKRKNKILICGGGPSIRKAHSLIQNWTGDIFASKTVEYLHNIDVTPHYCIHVDAGDNEPNRVFPNAKTNFLLSTQVKPEVFEAAKDCKVYKFNTITSTKWIPDNVIAGGSNSTIQAFFLSAWLGYKEIHTVGFDCGYEKDPDGEMVFNVNRNNEHSSPSQKVYLKDSQGNILYYTDTEYLGMAQEAARVIQILGRDKKIYFHTYGHTPFSEIVRKESTAESYELGQEVPIKWLNAS